MTSIHSHELQTRLQLVLHLVPECTSAGRPCEASAPRGESSACYLCSPGGRHPACGLSARLGSQAVLHAVCGVPAGLVHSQHHLPQVALLWERWLRTCKPGVITLPKFTAADVCVWPQYFHAMLSCLAQCAGVPVGALCSQHALSCIFASSTMSEWPLAALET